MNLTYWPVAYWAQLTWRVHLLVSCLFAFSYCSWGSQGKYIEVVCHSLLWSVLCKFCWFHCGINSNLLQEGLCHTQVCCTQSPCTRPLLTCTPTGDTQTQFWISLCGLGMHFTPFWDLRTSGDQVLGELTVLGGPCILITSPGPTAQFPGCAVGALSQVCPMSPLESLRNH